MAPTPELVAHALVDSHCHLDFPDFNGELPDILTRARAAGVTRMVTICTRLRDEPQVRALAEAHAGVFYAAGTHPMSAAEEPMATLEQLLAMSRHPKFVGLGETGLDYHYTAESAAAAKLAAHSYSGGARNPDPADHPCAGCR